MPENLPSSIRLEKRSTSGWITLDRHAKRNALDSAMIDGIAEGIREFGADPQLNSIVLAAEGSVFCGGADLTELGQNAHRQGIRLYATGIRALLDSPLPVIARVQGAAVAGGVGLVAACHLAVGTDRARFFTPEMRSGLYPLMVHALIESTVGTKRSFAMGLTGATISASQALELGLINELVAEAELDTTIGKWTDHIQQFEPAALRHSISALARTRDMGLIDRVMALQDDLDDLASGV